MEKSNSSGGGCMSEPEFFESNQQGRPSKARSEQRIGKKYALKNMTSLFLRKYRGSNVNLPGSTIYYEY